jgi:hypothetical protein
MSAKSDPVRRDLDQLSAFAAMDSDTATMKAAITTASANLKLAPGQYKVSLRGADATCDVYLAYGTTNAVTVAEPADTANNGDASAVANAMPSFRGDEIERITVTAAAPWVAFILSAGGAASKIKFVRMVS